jgi:predicted aminopeptidase
MIANSLAKMIMVAVLLQVSGCYYMQAAGGQLEIVRKREPIAELITAVDTPSELAARLQVVTAAREFSIDALGLPDNKSYRTYADLERDYVVWNVIAAPEFSLQPKTWCYPVVGCVSYRGYFSKDAAEKLVNRLRLDGYDIAFGGVAAYSTLGRFSDPILSTMMHWGDTDLVAVMFHELAHQVIYVKDDTGFNESFATAVEEFGMERWLVSRGQPDELADWRKRRALRSQFTALIAAARADLEEIYSRDSDELQQRQSKQTRLGELSVAAKTLFANAGRSAPTWLDNELNNARLAATTLYHGRLPEFRLLLAACDNDLACFYKAARKLADST